MYYQTLLNEEFPQEPPCPEVPVDAISPHEVKAAIQKI